LVVALVIALFALGALDYRDMIPPKFADIGFGITAGLLAVVAAFAIRPPGDEVTEAFTTSISTLPEDVLVKLRERTVQSEELRAFIEVTSNQIFLQKMEEVLTDAIAGRFKGSEIERLLNELDVVEAQLREVNLPVTTKEIPDRLRRTISAIRLGKDQSSALDEILRQLGFPALVRVSVRVALDLAGTATKGILPL
jgi:hypothetical protein